MKNSFYVASCRFHTKEKNRFVFVGYFQNNVVGDNKLILQLGSEKLDYTIEEKQLTPLYFKEMNGVKITKEFLIWTVLPENWRSYEGIKVWNASAGEKNQIFHVERKKLLALSERIVKHIDEIELCQNGWKISGWYIDDGNTSVRFFDTKGKEYPAKLIQVSREDVVKAYPECDCNSVKGFEAFFEGELPKKVRMHWQTADRDVDEWVRTTQKKSKNIIIQGKTMLQKANAYYRQFGLQATLARTGDKLFRREYTDYEQWQRRRRPSKGVLRAQRRKVFPYMPKISIVVPLYRTPEGFLREMVDSVEKQSYRNWELCLSDGSGTHSPLTRMLKEYEAKDKRIRVVYNEEQLHISENTNKALEICTGDYIAFMDHDDLLTPNALYECVKAINREPEIELIYSDEDKVNMDGSEYFQPHFKPDFSLDMLRSINYFCHLVVVKKELFQKVGELNSACDGAQDYDFVLRCVEHTDKIKHIQKVLYHWRAHKDSTAENPDSKAYGMEAGKKAIEGHYCRMGIQATVIPTKIPGGYRTKYELTETPLVSVIIPNKDHIADLDKCIKSIEEKGTYKNIEYVIVENNSQDESTFSYYQQLEAENKRAKVIYWEGKGFNYPAINTFGVKHAKGEYLLFLNNDTEIINSDCIEEMLVYCMRSDVGAVGARLYYEDGTIQHAGVIVGIGGVAGHVSTGISREDPGYFGRAMLAHNLSAVTAACMMMRKSVYEEVGGFDESYAVAFNDVDLCLRIREAGYLIVYNPYAELYHYESKSRGYEDTEEKRNRFVSEVYQFQSRWSDFLEQGDPYYNPNLSLNRNDFGVNLMK